MSNHFGGNVPPVLVHRTNTKDSVQDNGEPKFFLNNHLRFTVLHNYNSETDRSRIVGFEVEEYSVKHKYEGTFPEEGSDAHAPPLTTCDANRIMYVTKNSEPQIVQPGEEIIFTYDVIYQVSTDRFYLCVVHVLRAVRSHTGNSSKRVSSVHATALCSLCTSTVRHHNRHHAVSVMQELSS